MDDPNMLRKTGMGWAIKLAIVVILFLAVAGAVALKQAHSSVASGGVAPTQSLPAAPLPKADPPPKPLPRMAEFGSDKCIPCKAMMPVLEALRKDYAAAMEISFTDVMKDPEAGYQNKINIIPCQVFYDPSGKELFRHEGFFAKEDILAKWKELGYEMKPGAAHFPAQTTPKALSTGS